MRSATLSRILLAIAAVLITVPGLRLVVGTDGYVDGKDNLVLSPDLHSELNALGATFVAAGVALALGAVVSRFRLTATAIGVVTFLPQGVLRLLSYATEDGQHDSYLRAGIIETLVGVLLVGSLVAMSGATATSASTAT